MTAFQNCPHCGKPAPEENLRCIYCGERLPVDSGVIGGLRFGRGRALFLIVAALLLFGFFALYRLF